MQRNANTRGCLVTWREGRFQGPRNARDHLTRLRVRQPRALLRRLRLRTLWVRFPDGAELLREAAIKRFEMEVRGWRSFRPLLVPGPPAHARRHCTPGSGRRARTSEVSTSRPQIRTGGTAYNSGLPW